MAGYSRLNGLHCSEALPGTFARRKLCVLTAVLGSPVTARAAFTVVSAFAGLHGLTEAVTGLGSRTRRNVIPSRTRRKGLRNVVGRIFTSGLPLGVHGFTFDVGLNVTGLSVRAAERQGSWTRYYCILLD